MKVIYIIVRRVCCKKKNRNKKARKRRKKSTNMPTSMTTPLCPPFFLLFFLFIRFFFFSPCLHSTSVLLLLLLQFSSVVLCLISIGLFCRTRENIELLSILSSLLISQQYRHIIESPSTGNLSLIRFLFDAKKMQPMLHIVKLDKHT